MLTKWRFGRNEWWVNGGGGEGSFKIESLAKEERQVGVSVPDNGGGW